MRSRLATTLRSNALLNLSRGAPKPVDMRLRQTAMHSVGPAALDSFCATKRGRFYTPYLTPEQLIALTPERKQGFDLDALTQAGTAARAANTPRPYSAQSLGFTAPTKLGPKELIASIDAMDLTPLKKAGIRATACFDFDNTLAAGDIFYEFCATVLARASLPNHNRKRVGELLIAATHGKIRKSNVLAKNTDQLMAAALQLGRSGELEQAVVFFMMVAALRGMSELEINGIAKELFEKGAPGEAPYKNRFFSKDGCGSVALCKALEAKGIESHIITLGFPMVARIGARYLGIDAKNVHGSELEVKNGKFTGRALDAGVLGKHQLTDYYVSHTPLFCFGDTLGTDAPMLSRATVDAFVIDPRDDFHAHIAKNNADIRWLTYAS